MTINMGKVGQCIYCGISGVKLSKEHLVPYALDGPWVLHEASCNGCAAVTSTFERLILRDTLLQVRAALDLPTRHPKKRPLTYELHLTVENQKKVVQVPISESFAGIMLPILPSPPILKGMQSKNPGIILAGMSFSQVGGPYFKKLLAKHSASHVGTSNSIDLVAFACFLAKIGYGFVVAEYGPNTFRGTGLLSAMMRRERSIFAWVGGPEESIIPERIPRTENLHDIRVCKVDELVFVRIRLFARYSAPEYMVIIGELPHK
jgi:hypothetical protein